MPGAKRTTLSDTLSFLSTTAPQSFDPEDAYFRDAGGASSDSEGEGGHTMDRSHYAELSTSAIRKNMGVDFDLETMEGGNKYRGVRASRRDFFGSDSDDEHGAVSDGSEENEEAGQEELSDGDDGSDDVHMNINDDENEWVDNTEEEDVSLSMDEDSELTKSNFAEEDEDEIDSDNDGASSVSFSKKSSEKVMSKSKHGSQVKTMEVSDVVKGTHVRHQLSLFDSLLDLRIRAQKAVTLSNQLPLKEDLEAFLAAHEHSNAEDDHTKMTNELTSLEKDVDGLLKDLVDLQDALYTSNPSLPSSMHSLPAYTLDDTAPQTTKTAKKVLNKRYQSSRPYRTSTLQKWHQKTILATSGQQVLKNLKVLNRGLVEGIEATMRSDTEKSRVIKRTKLRRSWNPLVPRVNQQSDLNVIADNIDDENGAGKGSTDHHANLPFDAEAFDDSDFYTTLLRSVLSAKLSAGASGSASASEILNHLSKSKQRKNVDRRASKGRKIRYSVHDKLEGFMSSMPMPDPPSVPSEFRGKTKNVGVGANSSKNNGLESLYGISKGTDVVWTEERIGELIRSLFARMDLENTAPVDNTEIDTQGLTLIG